ncbi:hypothetical protein [Streptomyces sp. NPDC001604]|uniref:hypothetical protein n=1 Tax=Streptomyces sp. NPDC001604 TaxID=3364593 RepID=UPI0036B2910C
MKKRSMLAIASLATGFVVAAISPSQHADHQVVGDHQTLGDLGVEDTVGTVTHTTGDEGLAGPGKALGQ